MNNLVSVLICSYNAEQFIGSTIQSVLNQTYKNIEVLVLDNASTDRTVELLKGLQAKDKRLKVFDSKINQGAYPGLNYLLETAKGNYIAINDHDDIWHSTKLEKQIEILEKNKKFVGCGTAIINWYEEYERGIVRIQPSVATVAWHTSLVYRNEGYRYDVSKKVGTDFYFTHNILCSKNRKINNIREPLVLRRIWKGQKNLSSSWMKKMSFSEIYNLEIPLFDKLAIFSRKLFPTPLIEWLLVNVIHKKDTLDKIKMSKNNSTREYLTSLS